MSIPMKILQGYREMTLVADVMYGNGILFINDISCHIELMTA